MRLEGADTVLANLQRIEARLLPNVAAAAEEIAHLLANYAKAHHGDAPREAGWVYPGGGTYETVNNLYHRETGEISAGKVWRATRRWREGGIGWGDVTGQTQASTRAFVELVSEELVSVVLSAGTDYAKFLEVTESGELKKWAWLTPAVMENRTAIVDILIRRLRP